MARLLSQVGDKVYREWGSLDFAPLSFPHAVTRGLRDWLRLGKDIIAEARQQIFRTGEGTYHSPEARFSLEVQFMPENFRTGIWKSAANLFTFSLTGERLHVFYRFTPRIFQPGLFRGDLKVTGSEVARPGELTEWAKDTICETFQITPGVVTLNFYLGKKYPAPDTEYYRPGLALVGRDNPKFYKRQQILLFLQRVDPNFGGKVSELIKRWEPAETLRHLIRFLEHRPFSAFTEVFQRTALTLFANDPELKNAVDQLSIGLRERWSGAQTRDPGARLFMALFESVGFNAELLRTIKTVYPEVDLTQQILNWVRQIVLHEKIDAEFASRLLIQARQVAL